MYKDILNDGFLKTITVVMKKFMFLKKIKTWVFYRFARFSILTKPKINKSDLSNVQQKLLEITLSAIRDKDSELLINPEIDNLAGEKYYIKKYNPDNNEVEKFITISKLTSGYNITMVGHEIIDNEKHKYHFDVWFSDIFGVFVVGRFVKNLRYRRDEMEYEIKKDDEKTLDLILKKYKKTNVQKT